MSISYPINGYHLSIPLDQILSARKASTPKDIALTDCRNATARVNYTYHELSDFRDRIVAKLSQAGVEAQSRVGLYLEDSIGSLAAVYAVWSLGATLVPLDHRQTTLNLLSISRDAELSCIVYETEFETLNPLRTALLDVTFVRLNTFGAADVSAGPSLSEPEGVAIIAYTSGTTSNPKGVVIRHRHLRQAYSIAHKSLLHTTPKRFGTVFKVGGLGVLGLNYLLPMESGSTTVILPELTLGTARGYLEVLRDNRIDFLYLVPILVQLMQRLTRTNCGYNDFDAVTGAAPISQNLHADFQERFDIPLRNIYGMTEATFGIFYGRYDGERRAAWDLGPRVDSIETRIRLPDGSILKGSGEGILEVAGPTVTDGYLSNAEATEAIFKAGWIDSGDIVRRDGDGNYIVTGRSKDVVIRGGFNIHLDEVDHALNAHPSVLSACCVPLKAQSGAETIAAMVHVIARCDNLERDLIAFVKDRIGAAKVPNRLIVVTSDLPRNSSGKIIRRQVLSLVQATIERGES